MLPKPLGFGIDMENINDYLDYISLWIDGSINARQLNEDDIIKTKLSIRREASKIIMKLNLVKDNDGNIFFHDLVFNLMKRVFIPLISHNLSSKGRKIIQSVE